MALKPLDREQGLLAIGLLMAGCSSLVNFLSIPNFETLFQGLPRLPLATDLLLRFYGVVLLLPLPMLAAWRFWPKRGQRGVASLMTGFIVMMGSQALVQAILYLPVSDLGK